MCVDSWLKIDFLSLYLDFLPQHKQDQEESKIEKVKEKCEEKELTQLIVFLLPAPSFPWFLESQRFDPLFCSLAQVQGVRGSGISYTSFTPLFLPFVKKSTQMDLSSLVNSR